MTDDKQDGVRGWGARLATTLGSLVVLYVLSVGPVVGWAWRHSADEERHRLFEWLEAFYAPLIVVARAVPPLSDALFWYITLW